MSFYLPEEEDFVKRIKDLKQQAIENSKVSLLKFLDSRKQELVKYIIGTKDNVYIYFDGGFKNAEYKKCLITPFINEENNLNVDILKINYNKRFLKPNHRNILGALMNMGIKRESIGDIFIDEECYFACSKEISNYLIDEFKTLSNMPVNLEIVTDLDIEKKEEFEVKKAFVSSLRLDVIISSMYNLSRNESQEIIKNKMVKVNHVMMDNTSHMLKENDLLSVNKKGRMKLFSIGNTTSKGRICVEIGRLK